MIYIPFLIIFLTIFIFLSRDLSIFFSFEVLSSLVMVAFVLVFVSISGFESIMFAYKVAIIYKDRQKNDSRD